jgi:predicted O-linked N-acetylglucosamine transferase (SPINDLY family)
MSIDRNGSQSRNLQLAVRFHQNGDVAKAEALYKDVIRSQPKNADAIYLLGVLYAQQGRFEPAAASFGKAARVKPDFVDAHYNCGVMLNALGRHVEALTNYGKVLTLKPDHSGALQNRAGSWFELRRFEEALGGYEDVLRRQGEHPDTLDNRGVVLRELGRLDEALESHDRALAIAPNHIAAAINRGMVLRALGRADEAVLSYDRAISIGPDHAEAHHNRGIALLTLKRFEEALESCERATKLAPDHIDALQNRGAALLELGRFEEALRSFERVIELKPESADAYSNGGLALSGLKRFADAVTHFDRALQLKPGFTEAHNNRGLVFNDLGRFDEALENFDRALAVSPDYAEAWYNRGVALNELKRYEEAIASYDRVAAVQPDYDFIYGTRLNAKLRICDWSNLETDISALCDKVGAGERASHPFPLLASVASASVQRMAAEIWCQSKCPADPRLSTGPAHPRRDKIRLGYFSADFHEHAVARLVAEMFERHDRSKFELVAFSFDTDAEDDMRERLRSAFDEFIDVANMSDEEIARLARSREIDIAVDLLAFTKSARTNIFALRAAPVQVNYLGYPGTMGADYIDYLIADPILIPPADQPHYSEKIVYLPHCYQPNDRKRSIAERIFTRAEMGLPQNGFVFCCFNNNYKILPEVFDLWMQILKQAGDSVLWLLEDNASAAANLRTEARARGVRPDRLVFAKYLPMADHLARLRLADLSLDTLPYNAHTTASDALWAGVPLLTRAGETFAGRVAASLLTAIGLPELVTTTAQEYEALALELARNPSRLLAIRDKLAANLSITPLFDTPLYTGHIEAAYSAMYERHRAGLPPAHIHVPNE